MSTDHDNNDNQGHVLVVGSANQDLVAYAPRLPEPGETILGTTFETYCGGKGANQAVAAASLAFSPVSIICKVGKDSFGNTLLSNFQNTGVKYLESSVYAQDGIVTGVAPITVDNQGENNIIVCPGANAELTPLEVKQSMENLISQQTSSTCIVLVQLEIPMDSALQALKTGKELGCITILNPAPAPSNPLEEEFFKFTDIFIPNETELKVLTQGLSKDDETNSSEAALAKLLLAKGVDKSVIVTLGERGAMLVEKDGTITMVEADKDLPCNSLPVVDTVGAGDAFCGSLASYLSMGIDLREAANKACGVAGMSVRKRGAQSSYPTLNELPEQLLIPNVSKKVDEIVKPRITFVTGNKKKVEELQRLLGITDQSSEQSDPIPFHITNKKIDLPELQGEPEEIAIEKCKIATAEVNGPVLVEDTCLCFNALNGLPGPYIKWFLEKTGHEGLNNMLTGFEDKTAYAQTIFSLCMEPGGEVYLFSGTTDGTIVNARGALDFGWDPVFEPFEGDGKTYAELTKDEKNEISHRGKAFRKLKEFLLQKNL